jgi:hypothetical protein
LTSFLCWLRSAKIDFRTNLSSPEEWASIVVSRASPASWSIDVVCTVADLMLAERALKRGPGGGSFIFLKNNPLQSSAFLGRARGTIYSMDRSLPADMALSDP